MSITTSFTEKSIETSCTIPKRRTIGFPGGKQGEPNEGHGSCTSSRLRLREIGRDGIRRAYQTNSGKDRPDCELVRLRAQAGHGVFGKNQLVVALPGVAR